MPHPTPGCDDVACCQEVCHFNPACCLLEWDALCVQLAAKICAPDPACGVAGTGDCHDANGTPFCDDTCAGAACPGCCAIVCAVDPYCCGLLPDGNWDGFCATEAEQLCTCAPGDEPANDDCASAVAIGLGDTPVTNECATPDGPDHAECNDGFLIGLGLDVWYTHEATFTGELRVTTCNLVDPAWDTQLAVYEGCDCAALSDPPLGCNNDGAGCADESSEVVVNVVQGNCYVIRLGSSYLGPVGTGTLRLEPFVVPDACVDGIGDCLLANGTVGCADQACCASICANNPDCCDVDWDQACAAAAATQCPPLPCGPIDTSAANLDEGEPCGDDTNGGCNSTPPAFTDIVSGDVIAGTAWGDGGTRDTDWYRINVTTGDDADGDGQVDIHYNVLAELPVASFLLVDPVGNCNLDDLETPGTVAYSQSCTQIGFGMATVAAPGEYFVFAATGTATGGAVFDGYPCSLPGRPMFGNNYLLCVNVVDDGEVIDTTCPSEQDTCPWDLNDSGDVGILDLLALLAAWGPNPGHPADFDGDGTVGILDLLTLLANWGACP